MPRQRVLPVQLITTVFRTAFTVRFCAVAVPPLIGFVLQAWRLQPATVLVTAPRAQARVSATLAMHSRRVLRAMLVIMDIQTAFIVFLFIVLVSILLAHILICVVLRFGLNNVFRLRQL